MNQHDGDNMQQDLHYGNPLDLGSVYQAFSASSDLFDMSQEILDLVAHLTGADKCSLMMINDQGELYILNARGIEQSLARNCRIRVGEGIAGKIAAEGQPVLVQNISSDERYAIENRRKYRSGSFIACPISSRESVIGLLNISDKKDGKPFGEEEFDQAKMIAMIAAAALKNFLDYSNLKAQRAEVEDLLNRLLMAEKENREFAARISYAARAPLNNIKGAVYYLKKSTKTAEGREQEFHEIIEKEVNYLITYLDQGVEEQQQKSLSIMKNIDLKRLTANLSTEQ